MLQKQLNGSAPPPGQEEAEKEIKAAANWEELYAVQALQIESKVARTLLF